MPDTDEPKDPRALLNIALKAIEQDLRELLTGQTTRSTQQMAAISRYAKDLQSMVNEQESEALKRERELKKLSNDDIWRMIDDAKGLVDKKSSK
jgi:hypothetical protein